MKHFCINHFCTLPNYNISDPQLAIAIKQKAKHVLYLVQNVFLKICIFVSRSLPIQNSRTGMLRILYQSYLRIWNDLHRYITVINKLRSIQVLWRLVLMFLQCFTKPTYFSRVLRRHICGHDDTICPFLVK